VSAHEPGLMAPIVDAKATGQSFGARVSDAMSGGLRVVPVVIALVVIWMIFYSQNPAYLSPENLSNLSLQIVTTAMLALGVVFVLVVGEIDLSGAALGAVCATIAAQIAVNMGQSIWIALAVGILSGVLIAGLEGLIIVFGVPSLITTLGGMTALLGLLLVVMPEEFSISLGGNPYEQIAATQIPASVSIGLAVLASAIYAIGRWVTQRRLGSETSMLRRAILPALLVAVVVIGVVGVVSASSGLAFPVAMLILMLIVASYFMTQTRYGSHLFAVGGNRQAAARAGIPVARMVVFSFLILGACAAMAGMVDASRLLMVSPSSGTGSLMLDAIAAAVVGGTSLFGGRGTAWAALLGALVIGSINNGVELLGLSTEVQYFATAGVLVFAVAVDVVLTRGSLLPRRL
jgi:D-xylose transport system permease protein